MIDDYFDSVLIIDDKEEEISGLKRVLESQDIWVRYYHPENLPDKELRNRKLIFLDLSLDDSKSEVDNISVVIRPILQKNLGLKFGTYGIVLWTRHVDSINEFKKRVKNDKKLYSLPLFIVGLDKTIYLRNGFYTVFNDLLSELKNNTAANFFIQWSEMLENGKDRAIKNIYTLIDDYSKQNSNLKYILFQLAKHHTGIPLNKTNEYALHIDAFKAFSNILIYETMSNNQIKSDIFKDEDQILFVGNNKNYEKAINKNIYFNKELLDLKNEETKNKHQKYIGKLNKELDLIYSKINRKILFDEINNDQNQIIPGNVYKILDDDSYFNLLKVHGKGQPILIEMTPPCDFSNEKMTSPRVLGGIIADYSKNAHSKLKGEFLYKEIWPICLNDSDDLKMIIFDFRYIGPIEESHLLDSNKYQFLFRVKDHLFADILQKLSAHIARLGLSIIH